MRNETRVSMFPVLSHSILKALQSVIKKEKRLKHWEEVKFTISKKRKRKKRAEHSGSHL
jgi:hypothetical protein